MAVNPSFNPQPTLSVTNPPTSFDFHITTPRLYISLPNPSNESHIDHAIARLQAPSNLKHSTSAPRTDRSAARAWLSASAERNIATGYGRFVVSLRTGGASESASFSSRQLEHIGFVSMQLQRYADIPGPTIPDLGFMILPRYRGKGFANEAASHLMAYFRERKGVRAFAGLTDGDNGEAQRLFGRLGFRAWGVRRVRGVREGEIVCSVWTVGVEGEEGELVGLGL